MAISRREFLKKTAAAVALSTLNGSSAEAKAKINEDKELMRNVELVVKKIQSM